jgi:2-haloalkanoic acid dehalogenase type II
LRAAIGSIKVNGQQLLTAYVEEEKGQESTYKKYRDVLRLTAKSLSGGLGVPVSDGAAAQFAASVPNWPAFPDTADFLKEMGARGFKRYILSNVDNDLLEETISKNHLEVEGFVTAEEVGSYKPNPGHWIRFMQKYGAEKEEILHVAQSVFHDIVPTGMMGIDSAWVNRYQEPMPLRGDPLFITDSLAHLAGQFDEKAA